MTPYSIYRRVLGYVEDDTEAPMLRRIINEAIQQICKSNPPGKDYAFLKTPTPVGVEYSSFNNGVYPLPDDCRVIIDIAHVSDSGEMSTPNPYVRIEGDRQIHLINASQTFVGKVRLTYYRQHPTIYNSSVADNEELWYDTAWEPKNASQEANPPESSILIPREEHELIIWTALDLAYENDIEVATQRQLIESRIKEGYIRLAANYAISTYVRGMPVIPTVGWLIDWGTLQAGGERYRYVILEMLRTVAYEIANKLKLSAAQRTSLSTTIKRIAYEDELPQIEGKAIPIDLWKKGLLWHIVAAGMQQGTEQIVLSNYKQALDSFLQTFYAEDVAGDDSFSMSTYGDAVKYLRSIWKTHENEAQLWTILNEAVHAVMSRINIEELRTSWEFTTTGGTTEYTVPDNLKQVYLVYYDGKKIPGRGEHSDSNLEVAPFAELEGQGYDSEVKQSFYIAGKRLVFNQPPASGVEVSVKYFPRHVYTTNGKTPLPVEATILLKYCEARIALEEKPKPNMTKYSILSREFADAVREYYANQDNSIPQLQVIKSGYPTTSDLMNLME